jgi:hypothetical protein
MAEFDKVPLEWLYYVIDGYVSDSELHKHGAVVKPGFVPTDIPEETTFGITIPAPIP